MSFSLFRRGGGPLVNKSQDVHVCHMMIPPGPNPLLPHHIGTYSEDMTKSKPQIAWLSNSYQLVRSIYPVLFEKSWILTDNVIILLCLLVFIR